MRAGTRIGKQFPACKVIEEKPTEEAEEMRAGKFGDAVPENTAVFLHGLQISERQILNPLRIKMHFIVILGGETFQQFGDCAFGAVPAVNEWRDDRDAHVRRLAAIDHS